MGRSTDAILAYGYDLGGPDEWRLKDLGKWGQLPELEWLKATGDDDQDEPDTDDEYDEEDFHGRAEEHLLRTVGGFTEEWTEGAGATGYFDRRNAAEKRVGVQIRDYCSDGSPSYLLAAHTIRVARGDIEHIDPADLLHRPATEDWDSRLVVALDALGIAPAQETPRWLLVSYGTGF
ncbi:hypothetical protein SUDANB1_05608 [Streptomyces sp. enrichment culture]|uniref:hypothetical protein n=1 Tax=Streptomyces sp. enrichment culture TaxID=1795815 RepID=UPI003F5692E6